MDFSNSENAKNNQENGIKDCQGITETVDPDYVSILPEKLKSKVYLSEQQQDAKDNAVQKIKNIVRKQFTMEMHLKEQEIETIDQRIRQTKTSLDRLRACILARYYGMSQDFQEESLIRSFGGKSSWNKPRRSRRECASNQSSSKVLKSHRSKQLNSSGGFSARDLGNSQLSSLMDIKTNNPPLGKKSSSFEDNKNPVSTALFNFENTACVNLKMTNGEAERTSVVAKVSALATSGNSNLSASMKKGSQLQSIVTSDISINHSSAARTSSLGRYSSGYLDLKGIQLNASGTQLSANGTHLSASGTQSNASRIVSSASLQRSNLVDTPAKFMKSHLAVTSSEETSKNAQGSQLNGSSILKVTHMNATKDAVCQSNAFGSGARFYVKKRVIIGNTSKYIPPEKREENDKSTHKWMVYVRGPPEDPHIDVYIQKVWFFLHPSYRPNDIIEVNKPPFHLTRRGWGEFPIRVQLHFVGTRNKRVDIIHELKLDKTYTGLQTLGAETVVDLEIDKKTFEDLGIPVSWEIPQDTSSASDTTSKMDINSIKNPGVVKLKRELSSSATSSETGQLLGASSVKRSRLDTPMSSVASTPCGSRISSRCASPVLRNTSEILENGTEDYLHSFAEKIPLISSKKNVVSHPFSARTAEEFLSWNVGKRRAAEWQRAAKIRAQLKKCAENTDITTKSVMIWCRRFGYTPQENLMTDEKVEYCKICGKITEQAVTKENLDTGIVSSCAGEKCSKVAQMELSSLTLVEDILKEVEDKEKLFNETTIQKVSEEDVDIDVISSFDTKKPSVSIPNSLGTISIPLTPQQHWVKDICNDIGISLRPVTIQNVEINAVESMLLKLAMKFAEILLRKASSLSKKDDASLDPNLIVPVHIYQAIGSLSLCDFMGNAFFGHASEDQP